MSSNTRESAIDGLLKRHPSMQAQRCYRLPDGVDCGYASASELEAIVRKHPTALVGYYLPDADELEDVDYPFTERVDFGFHNGTERVIWVSDSAGGAQ